MDLPEELSRLVLEKLPQESLDTAAGVCKTWAADVSDRRDRLVWHIRSDNAYSKILHPSKEYRNPIKLEGFSLKKKRWDTYDLRFLTDFVAEKGKPQGYFGPFGYENKVEFQGSLGAFVFASWAGLWAKWMVVVCDIKSKSMRALPVFGTFRKTVEGISIYADDEQKRLKVAVSMAPVVNGERHLNIFDSANDKHWDRLHNCAASSPCFFKGDLYALEPCGPGYVLLKYIEEGYTLRTVVTLPFRCLRLQLGPNNMQVLSQGLGVLTLHEIDGKSVEEVACLGDEGRGQFVDLRYLEGALYAVQMRRGFYKLLRWNGSWEVVFEDVDDEKYDVKLLLRNASLV